MVRSQDGRRRIPELAAGVLGPTGEHVARQFGTPTRVLLDTVSSELPTIRLGLSAYAERTQSARIRYCDQPTASQLRTQKETTGCSCKRAARCGGNPSRATATIPASHEPASGPRRKSFPYVVRRVPGNDESDLEAQYPRRYATATSRTIVAATRAQSADPYEIRLWFASRLGFAGIRHPGVDRRAWFVRLRES